MTSVHRTLPFPAAYSIVIDVASTGIKEIFDVLLGLDLPISSGPMVLLDEKLS